MTAPASPLQSLFQTIFTLRELQQRDEAARLAREQFGLQTAATQEQMLGHFQGLLANAKDPKALIPHLQEFAKRTGFSQQALQTLTEQAVPSAATQAGASIQEGVAQTGGPGGSLAIPAATTALTGKLPGGLAEDDFNNTIFSGATRFVKDQAPTAFQAFMRGVAQKRATGQSIEDATYDQLVATLPKETLDQAYKVGKGIAPDANHVIQTQLGVQQLMLQRDVSVWENAIKRRQLDLAMMEVNAKVGGERGEKVNQILRSMQEMILTSERMSGTLTEKGTAVNNATYNAWVAQLQQLAPEIFGRYNPQTGKIEGAIVPLEPIPLKGKESELGATSPFGAMFNQMKKSP